MALLFMDGFDAYAVIADKSLVYESAGTNISVSTSSGRFSGGAFIGVGSTGAVSATLQKVIPLSTDLWVAYAIYPITMTSGATPVIAFASATGPECAVSFDTNTGQWVARRGTGSAGTSLGSAIMTPPTINTWHWVEFHFTFHGSTGVVEVWWDGVQILNLTGLNTKNNAGETGITSVRFGGDTGTWSGAGTFSWRLDDLVIIDTTGSAPLNGRLGDCRISTLLPSSDATPNDGTLSTGTNHYAVLDEAQWNTSDYSDIANTAGLAESCGCASLSTSPAIIYAVQAWCAISKTDAGAASGKIGVVSSGVSSFGSNFALSTSWTFNRAIFPTDPNTSAAWVAAGVNSAKIKYEVV